MTYPGLYITESKDKETAEAIAQYLNSTLLFAPLCVFYVKEHTNGDGTISFMVLANKHIEHVAYTLANHLMRAFKYGYYAGIAVNDPLAEGEPK